MESQSGDKASKLLQAQSHECNRIFSFINSISFKCAVDLGILEAINNYGQPMPFSKLIASLLIIPPSKTSFIQRLMRILIQSGFFVTKNVADKDLEVCYVLIDSYMLHCCLRTTL
ncbi:hypothetical protein Ahy_A07g032630 [Arachis hypogaea]|uniref:O-methyltransferase dimerisation domain-containing protein n=1 Tax=Arachis hypogaea TaxID=3818 RepID=A0A445C789_ARAHY|nr:hypothetical protein Ahy_A07g032630 [Arachis hypogaea]